MLLVSSLSENWGVSFIGNSQSRLLPVRLNIFVDGFVVCSRVVKIPGGLTWPEPGGLWAKKKECLAAKKEYYSKELMIAYGWK